MRLAVDRHREIRSCALRRQRSGRLGRKIGDLDIARVRHIDKNLGPGFVDLKTFRMSLETDIGRFGPGCRIDHRERAVAVTHEHPIALSVDPHIVGILAELDASDRRKIIAAQYVHRAVAGIRHKDAVGKRDIGDALRLAQAGDPAQHLAGCQIDHAKAVVAELGNEQPLTLRIDGQVIDPATAPAPAGSFVSSTSGAFAVCCAAIVAGQRPSPPARIDRANMFSSLRC